MSTWENSLFSYIDGRLAPIERAGKCYFFRNNSFAGKLTRYNGSTGYIKNNKLGAPDVIACFGSAATRNQGYPYGTFVGFELKSKTGKQSLYQKMAQKTIESAGGRYYVVKTPEQFEEILKELL